MTEYEEMMQDLRELKDLWWDVRILFMSKPATPETDREIQLHVDEFMLDRRPGHRATRVVINMEAHEDMDRLVMTLDVRAANVFVNTSLKYLRDWFGEDVRVNRSQDRHQGRPALDGWDDDPLEG